MMYSVFITLTFLTFGSIGSIHRSVGFFGGGGGGMMTTRVRYNHSDEGAAALHKAAEGGHVGCIEVLLKSGRVTIV